MRDLDEALVSILKDGLNSEGETWTWFSAACKVGCRHPITLIVSMRGTEGQGQVTYSKLPADKPVAGELQPWLWNPQSHLCSLHYLPVLLWVKAALEHACSIEYAGSLGVFSNLFFQNPLSLMYLFSGRSYTLHCAGKHATPYHQSWGSLLLLSLISHPQNLHPTCSANTWINL